MAMDQQLTVAVPSPGGGIGSSPRGSSAGDPMARSAGMSGTAFGGTGSSFGMEYTELDLEREEDFDLSSLDDLLSDMAETVKDTRGPEAQRMKTLEKTIENEKRRLAQMEVELRDAKRQREAGGATLLVQKQGKMIEGMLTALTRATKKEASDRVEWEEEWQKRTDELSRQHRGLDEALRRRHEADTARMEREVASEVKRVAMELSGRGRPPSAGTLSRIQKEKMKVMVQLFHNQGQERMYLHGRHSEQEEELLRAKNDSRQRFLAQSQARSNPVYKQYNLPTVSVHKGGFNDSTAGGQPSFASMSPSKHAAARRGVTPGAASVRSTGRMSPTRGRTPGTRGSHGPGSTRRSATAVKKLPGPLPSPRLDLSTTGATFLTGIEDDEEAPTFKGRKGGLARTPSRGGSHPATPSLGSNLGSMGPRSVSRGGSPMKGPADSQLSVQDLGGGAAPFGKPGQVPQHSGKMVGTEFAARDPPKLPPKEGGRDPWDTRFGFGESAPAPPRRWHPNVIAFESAMNSTKAKKPSPYEQPLDRTSNPDSGSRTAPAGASRRKPGATGGGGGTRSKSAMGAAPGGGKGAGGGGGAEGDAGNLPHIQGGRNQPTESNMNRPVTDSAKNDDYQLSSKDKYLKLEEWIEAKIHGVLGGGGAGGGAARAPSRNTESYGSHEPHYGSYMSDQQGPESTLASRGGLASRSDVHSRGLVSTAGDGGFGASRGASTAGASRGGLSTAESFLEGDESEAGQASAGGGGGEGDAVDDLMSKLTQPDNVTGLSVVDRKEKELAKEKTQREWWGHEVPQQAEHDDVSAKAAEAGKWTRDGRHVELKESEDVEERRRGFDASSTKSKRGITWDPATEGGGEGEGGEGRPDTSLTSASVFTTASEDAASPPEGRKGRRGSVLAPAEPEKQVDKGQFFSAVRHNKVDDVEAMLGAGFGLQERDPHGNSPLMVAAQNGHKRLVKMFLRYGGDPNASNHQGNTALHFASAYGYSALAQYLIQKGADDTLINNKGLLCYDGLG